MATQLPPAGDARTLYIIDVSGYIFRAYHAMPPMETRKGEPTHAVRGVTAMLGRLVKDREPALLAVAMDSRGKGFRHAMYPEYKANRPPCPPDLSPQIVRVGEVVRAYGIPTFEVPGVEADDIIASLTRLARERDEPFTVVVVSADKDMLQLIREGVVMFDPTKGKVFGDEETKEKMGVLPNQVRDYLALTGDSSDNVPGVRGVGPKTAVKLLDAYKTFEGVFEHRTEVKGKALKARLEEHEEMAKLSRKLVSLKDDLELEFEPEKLQYGGADVDELRRLFMELEFNNLLGGLKAPSAKAEVRVVRDPAKLSEIAAAIRAAGRVAIFPALEGEDDRKELVGLGLAYTKDAAVYVPLQAKAATQSAFDFGEDEDEGQLASLGPLVSVLENPDVSVDCADAKQALNVFSQLGVSLAGVRFDAMVSSYLIEPESHGHSLAEIAKTSLHLGVVEYDAMTKEGRRRKPLATLTAEEVGTYAAVRASVVMRVYDKLQPRMQEDGVEALFEEVEVPLSHVLSEMEQTGICIDQPMLAEMSTKAGEELARLEKRCHELATREFNVGSPRELETILFDELELPVVKRTKTSRSTDRDTLDELSSMHDLPGVIIEYRQIAKLKSTYLDSLPKKLNASTGRVHTRFNQAVAATGRLSSSEPNLQNIPIRTEMGRRIRKAFVPQKDWGLLAADYSQIELRVLAHLSQDPELVDAFTKGEDVHVRTATALFECAAEDVTREQRGQAKTVNFAVIYGQTQFALARNLGIRKRDAKRYIDAFFERYAGVKSYMDELIEGAKEHGEVRTLMGRRRAVPGLRSRNRVARGAAERIARNTPIQGSAADIMKVAMVRVRTAMMDEELQAQMLLTVHDELVFEAPQPERERLEKLVREEMMSATKLSVPLLVDVGWGKNWDEAH